MELIYSCSQMYDAGWSPTRGSVKETCGADYIKYPEHKTTLHHQSCLFKITKTTEEFVYAQCHCSWELILPLDAIKTTDQG